MGFSSKIEALLVLGLPKDATKDQIKSAYKKLVRKYHPDEHPNEDVTWQYYDVQGAYDYLMEHMEDPEPAKPVYEAPASSDNVRRYSGPKVFGSKEDLTELSFKRKVRAEHVRQEKRMEKRAEEEKKAMKKEFSEYRQNKVFEETMDRIHAHRAAEVTAQIIEAYLKGNM